MILFTHKVFSLSSSLSYILLFVMSNVSFIVYASSALKAERTAAETERKGKISEHTHVFLIKDIWKFLFGMEMVILGFFKVQEERYWYIIPVERKKRNKTTHRYGFSMHHQMEFIHFLLKLFCSQQFSLVIRHFPFIVVTASVFASSFDIMCCAYIVPVHSQLRKTWRCFLSHVAFFFSFSESERSSCCSCQWLTWRDE